MKQYTVWYIIKRNNRGYVHHSEVEASNQKEAMKLTEEDAKQRFDRHAFSKTTKEPVWEGGEPSDWETRPLTIAGDRYSKAFRYGKQVVVW